MTRKRTDTDAEVSSKSYWGMWNLIASCALIDMIMVNEIDEEGPVIVNNSLFKMYPTNPADTNHAYKANMSGFDIVPCTFGSVPVTSQVQPCGFPTA